MWQKAFNGTQLVFEIMERMLNAWNAIRTLLQKQLVNGKRMNRKAKLRGADSVWLSCHAIVGCNEATRQTHVTYKCKTIVGHGIIIL